MLLKSSMRTREVRLYLSPVTKTRECRVTAYHEAGHAVIAARMGIPFRRVTIQPNAVYAGHVTLCRKDPPEQVNPWNPDWDARRARQYWKRHICGLLAGALAETLHTRVWQQQPVADEDADEYKAQVI